MLVRPHHRRVHRDHPPRPGSRIAPGPQPVQDHLPRPIPRPAAMPVIDGLPVPEPLRQVPPRVARTGPVEDPVDHQPVIIPPVPLPRMPRQQRLQPRPFRITEVMPPQPFLIHGAIKAETTYTIYGTRPSPAFEGGRCSETCADQAHCLPKGTRFHD